MCKFCELAILVLLCVRVIKTRSPFCHCEPVYEPTEGFLRDLQFTWLGILQYIHVKNGTPHYFRAPRVVLVSEQYVLSTAADAAIVPGGYALGNVVFTEYERDDEECGITTANAATTECDVSVMLMPIADVLVHPHFRDHGIVNSVALLKLLKPVKSYYMLPVCLPWKDHLDINNKNKTKETLYHIDYVSDVPRDYVAEDKYVSILTLPPQDTCFRDKQNESKGLICSSECGLNSGAPTVTQENTGHFTLVSLATGGQPCEDPLRDDEPPPAPRHIQIFPFLTWISYTISGADSDIARDDPFGLGIALGTANRLGRTSSWLAHWYMSDDACYFRIPDDTIFKFHHEVFTVDAFERKPIAYNMQILTYLNSIIVCVKVHVPNRVATPKIYQDELNSATIEMELFAPYKEISLEVVAYAKNQTAVNNTDYFEYYG